jgi:hypothetical protein
MSENAGSTQGTIQPTEIFRQEAIDELLRGSGAGEVLRLASRWASRAYLVFMLLLVAGLAISMLVRVPTEAPRAVAPVSAHEIAPSEPLLWLLVQSLTGTDGGA